MRATVAVLFGSYFKVNHESANLRAKLIQPLKADTFLFLTFRADETQDDQCNSIDSCKVRSLFRCLEPITRIEMEAQLTTRELVDLLESSPGWADLSRMYRLLSGCVRHMNSSTCANCFRSNASSPYRCSKPLPEGGNLFLAPVIGKSNINVLRQLHMQVRALKMLAAHEESSDRNGAPYKYVVWSRLEYVWLRPHPSPDHLALGGASFSGGAGCLWVPLGEDYGGLNDRHAFMPRALAPTYLGRWNMIRNGRLMEAVPCLHPNHAEGKPCAQSSERLLAAIHASSNISICRFPPLAYLQCCKTHGESRRHATSHCYKVQCHVATWPASGNGTFQRPSHSSWHVAAKHLSGKYPQELATALVHASVLEVRGVQVGLGNMRWPPQGFWHAKLQLGHSLVVYIPAAGAGGAEPLRQWSHAIKRQLNIMKGYRWTIIRRMGYYRDAFSSIPARVRTQNRRLLDELLVPIGDEEERPTGPWCHAY